MTRIRAKELCAGEQTVPALPNAASQPRHERTSTGATRRGPVCTDAVRDKGDMNGPLRQLPAVTFSCILPQLDSRGLGQWWIALGLVCLISWGILLFARAWRDARAAGGYGQPGSDALGWLVCSLPILLHTQGEYPLYQSHVRYTDLILLLGLSVSRLNTPHAVRQPAGWTSRGIRITDLVAGLGVIVFAVTASRVSTGISMAEQTTGLVVQPRLDARQWNPRYETDAVNHGLLLRDIRTYGITRAADSTAAATAAVLRGYVARHLGPNAYAMYLGALGLQGNMAEYRRVMAEAHWRVSWNPRFAPAGALAVAGQPPAGNVPDDTLTHQQKGD